MRLGKIEKKKEINNLYYYDAVVENQKFILFYFEEQCLHFFTICEDQVNLKKNRKSWSLTWYLSIIIIKISIFKI